MRFIFIAVLLLLGFSVTLSGKPFKGAEYRTNIEMLYGKFEIRMKSAAGSGLIMNSSFSWNSILTKAFKPILLNGHRIILPGQ